MQLSQKPKTKANKQKLKSKGCKYSKLHCDTNAKGYIYFFSISINIHKQHLPTGNGYVKSCTNFKNASQQPQRKSLSFQPVSLFYDISLESIISHGRENI